MAVIVIFFSLLNSIFGIGSVGNGTSEAVVLVAVSAMTAAMATAVTGGVEGGRLVVWRAKEGGAGGEEGFVSFVAFGRRCC